MSITDENNKKLIDEFHEAVKRFKSNGFFVESNLALHDSGRIHIGITITNYQKDQKERTAWTAPVVNKASLPSSYHYPPGWKQ